MPNADQPMTGGPGSEPPRGDEPTQPREPLPRKPDQGGPATVSATGAQTDAEHTVRAQTGAYLTTAQGLRLPDSDHSLRAGARGPTLLQDHHLREKLTHFDHERIPERVVHARGAAAHGVFVGYGSAASVCRAAFLGEGVTTPVFVRFSNVVGSRGSADVVRDTRGFATKFYTGEGTFDLVGNNIPVFFIQDGIKFPDIVHAAKPHPDREIPQAQSAHDTFWDFVSLHTEATAHVMWQMSDRGIPRSWRTMEGFGVHTNYFAETEQVAFHPGNLVPGIDVTDDPLLQARLFSYIDTQLLRLGGPNFTQLPINRPHAPVNDMLRDGFHQHADQVGAAPYRPNSLDGGCPFTAGAELSGYVEVPRPVAQSAKVREAGASYADHTSQVRQFWLSLTPVEKEHTIQAFTFELGKCYETPIRERELRVLANVDPELCAGVAAGLGLPAPAATEPLPDVRPSPALSQVGQRWPVTGRIVGIVTGPDGDLDAVRTVRERVAAGRMVPLVVSATGGTLANGSLVVDRTFLTARSTEFDAILVCGAPAPAADASAGLDAKAGQPAAGTVDPRVTLMLAEAFRHAKPIGGWGGAQAAFQAAGFDASAAGVVLGDDPEGMLSEVLDLLAEHRVWHRFPASSAARG